jgi:hypothetical protein
MRQVREQESVFCTGQCLRADFQEELRHRNRLSGSAPREVSNERKAECRQIGILQIGGDIEIHRFGFGAMRITGPRVWGPPIDTA